MKPTLLLGFAALALAALPGCGDGTGLGPSRDYVKPSIAVMKFDSRAAFPMDWDLGGGMRDVLVDRLLATGRFHVIERPELDFVLGELQLQNSGVTREQDRARIGRLKNVQYLIKGTITDFGHVSTSEGFLGIGGTLGLSGGGNCAVMSMTLYVVDVESGEIAASESLQKSVRAGDVALKAQYRDVTFGGSTFYRTPLGKATAEVIDDAVRKISRELASRPWTPKIAKIHTDGRIILNGGTERLMSAGTEYAVYGAPTPITDPDTGDIIGHLPGEALGRVRVCEVHGGYSVADVLAGDVRDFAVGQLCRPVDRVAMR